MQDDKQLAIAILPELTFKYMNKQMKAIYQS